ncbi:ABC transporter permease [Skermanella stibiiresistens SB22]|uniref:ABC transporter permease n=1 Tax=Skermanella stibiiresistens SB22 TaxID=1385369 RepID=W9HAF4_9PROT|nr:ABC transporter permease [Skermanella stibiiresistens]EWY41716.1 ABC transporter permease [Skermanella stibiiresistens SB22]
MSGYVTTRMLHSAISMMGLIVLVFFLARLTGNPTDLYLPIDAPAEVRAAFAKANGFDQPLLAQFQTFLGNLVQFDFGNSLRLERPAVDLVLQAFPTSLILAGTAMTIALVVAVVAGSLAARNPNGVLDRFVNMIALAGASLPNFWLALVSVLVFAVGLRWLPTSGTGGLSYWILPVMVLTVRPCGLLAQVVRGAMISALSSAYVKTARAKGVKKRVIVFVHALRNAMLPIITVAGDQASGMINGAVVVEMIFGFPGIGRLMMESIQYRDFAVIQAGVIVTAAAIFLLNIVIDLAYALLDPRIKHA